MACLIILRVKGKSFTYTTNLDPQNITLDNIVKEIYNKEIEYKSGKTTSTGKILVEVANLLSNAKSLEDSNESVKKRLKESLENADIRVVGNYTLDMLNQRFPKVGITEKLKSNEEIIYSKDLSLEGIGFGGKLVIGKQSIFVIGDEIDAYKLKNYLKARDEMNKENFQLKDLTNQETKALNFVKQKHSNLKTDIEALKYFFENSSTFLFDLAENNIDVYTTLKNYIKSNVINKRTRLTLSNPVANTVLLRSKFDSENSQYIVSPTLFKNILLMYGDTDKIKWINLKEYKNADSDGKTALTNDFKDSIKSYLSEIFYNSERPLEFYVSDVGKIYITSPYRTIKDTDYEFNKTELAKEVYEENGYKIICFNDKDYYITKERVITLNSYLGSRYSNFDSAKKTLSEILEHTTIINGYNRYLLQVPELNSGVNVFEMNTKFKAPENTIIEILNYRIPENAGINDIIEDTKYLALYNLNLDDLKNYIKEKNKDANTDIINSYEKAMIFIIELSKVKDINKALNTIENLQSRNFLVINKINDQITLTDEFELKNQDPESEEVIEFPMATLLTNTVDLLNNKWRLLLGKGENEFLIKLISPSDFKEEGIPETINKRAKGFIYKGTIYLNQAYVTYDTVFHELGHLVLGIIKAENFSKYTELIEKLSKDAKIKNRKLEKALLVEYQSLADEDLTEEAFVDMFGEFIKNNRIGQKDFLENSTNQLITKSIESFGSTIEGFNKLSDLFSNMSNNILSYLQKGSNIDYDVELAKNRQVTNKISKMLQDQTLEMKCW